MPNNSHGTEYTLTTHLSFVGVHVIQIGLYNGATNCAKLYNGSSDGGKMNLLKGTGSTNPLIGCPPPLPHTHYIQTT